MDEPHTTCLRFLVIKMPRQDFTYKSSRPQLKLFEKSEPKIIEWSKIRYSAKKEMGDRAILMGVNIYIYSWLFCYKLL